MRLIALIVVSSVLCACNTSPRLTSYTTPSESERNPLRAQALTQEATEVIGEDPQEAERLLREAIAADLYYAPAHNNLGTLYLAQGKLYEAAHEFEWASTLMPGHPDPRMNLALTLERAGRIDKALDTYDEALDAYPGHIATIQAKIRCQLRHARTDVDTRAYLETIALQGSTPEWRTWAREQSLRASDRMP